MTSSRYYSGAQRGGGKVCLCERWTTGRSAVRGRAPRAPEEEVSRAGEETPEAFHEQHGVTSHTLDWFHAQQSVGLSSLSLHSDSSACQVQRGADVSSFWHSDVPPGCAVPAGRAMSYQCICNTFLRHSSILSQAEPLQKLYRLLMSSFVLIKVSVFDTI